MKKSEFKLAIKNLRSKDPMTYEEGYHSLIGHVDKYYVELVELMQKEDDVNVKGKLIEVLGDSKSDNIIPILATELMSDFRDIRFWAYSTLSYLEQKEAIELVSSYKAENPSEDWY